MEQLEIIRRKADTKEMSAIEWCIYWADLTDTDEESDVPEQAAAELAALISESQSRQRALVEKSDELTTEWKRAEKAEAQLARITAENIALRKLLAHADVAFRCDLTQPEANDYYWQTREDIAARLK